MRGDSVGDRYTIGIGDVSTLGGGTTLGVGTSLGGGNTVGVADGGARAVLVFQWAKRLQSFDISNSFSWWTVVEASLTAQDKKFRAWMIMSLEVTSSWVR